MRVTPIVYRFSENAIKTLRLAERFKWLSAQHYTVTTLEEIEYNWRFLRPQVYCQMRCATHCNQGYLKVHLRRHAGNIFFIGGSS
ncbi:hypothetical protein CSKR_104635 [Clonorchis sinensis]|uniref:Uncharacterized protein n=1 Tax=Clonorchis sinensis TaxID=79923 RepID=A0A8T1M889_CLOSI|nr:hypothetical protein CSKR_104635 [Clonorchis sinensis]